MIVTQLLSIKNLTNFHFSVIDYYKKIITTGKANFRNLFASKSEYGRRLLQHH